MDGQSVSQPHARKLEKNSDSSHPQPTPVLSNMASHTVVDQLSPENQSYPIMEASASSNHLSDVGPEGYIQARIAHVEQSFVDHQPYLPALLADPTDLESIKRVACQILNANGLLPVASTPSFQDLTVSSVSGGITNILYRVSGMRPTNGNNDDNNTSNLLSPDSVLVRVFGGHGMIDRDIENATFSALWKAGIAPTYYGRFGNGRVEEYKPYRALVTSELSEKRAIAMSIMRKMSKLHSNFQVPLHLLSYHNPGKPSMWIQLEKWMPQALACSFRAQQDTERAKALELHHIRSELSWLRKVIPNDSAMAFCHNDLLAANILYDEDRSDVVLIDFEYGGCNFCAFDIANFFNEFAGGTVDGIPNYDWCPSPQDQAELVRCYLQEREKEDAVIHDDQVQAWLAEVALFQLANHLYWGLWAVIQAGANGCDEFDYLLYGSYRIRQYYKSKNAQFPSTKQ